MKRLKPRKAILYTIGSIAKGEPSCMRMCDDLGGCSIIVSDLDLLVLTDILTYLNCKLLQYRHYTKKLETLFLKRGMDLHISFALVPLLMYRIEILRFNTIDLYELATVICDEDKQTCEIRRKERFIDVNVYDLLDLAISSFVDVLSVILKLNNEIDAKSIYVLSKRILTLLYCIELYLGLRPRSFSETPLIATINFEKLNKFIDENDLKLLNLLSKIKSYSKCQEVAEVSQINVEELIRLYIKLLRGFLIGISNDLGVFDGLALFTRIKDVKTLPRKKLIPFVALLVVPYVVLYVTALLSRKDNSDVSRLRDELAVVIRYRMRLADLLRLLALKYLVVLLIGDLQRIVRNANLVNAGLKIVSLWNKYMAL